ncbi:Mannan endo-1,4-beta-mannosidase [Flagellimonas maritima]|uniref:Mannan endo-1,4-beta-mannosidase n=1 Tax=Flagellimonas maritima TaxID=1383885 RepID=A0A2Z4LT78_9FLAO|nr:DUF6443 domain-containing protein [Allomuricauda aurantiaca]AWX45125.1 Mannan endo-1,4-beta-mannosidase [Allomuricauda aurantiaca]
MKKYNIHILLNLLFLAIGFSLFGQTFCPSIPENFGHSGGDTTILILDISCRPLSAFSNVPGWLTVTRPSGNIKIVCQANTGASRNASITYQTSSGMQFLWVNQNAYPAVPLMPSITQNCGSIVLTRGNPPTNITWYWQSSSGGTSTVNSSPSITRTSGSVYYLRARNSGGEWGTARTVNYSINSIPSIPSTPSVSNNCGNSVLTRSNPPNGVTWYWQSSSGGTSISNSSSSITLTSGSVYYLRARSSSGCWGSARTVNYSIKPIPPIPSVPTITNNCDSTVLTRSNPSSGTTWYWQSSSGGTSTSNSELSVIRTSGSVYYLRGRSSAGCWGSSRTINYSINQSSIYYADTDGDGYGDPSNTTNACSQPSGHVINSSDYDDGTVFITNILPQMYYSDRDGDGIGDGASTVYTSFRLLGYASTTGDPCPDDSGTITGCPDQTTTLSNENYVHTISYQDPNGTTAIERVTYYDGLGRPIQQVGIRASGTSNETATANTAAGWAMDWTIGDGSTGFFNQNGNTSENQRVLAPGPFGQQEVVWRCGNDPGSNSDGGWNTEYFTVDRTKTYRYMVWVNRFHSNDGTTYHGTQNVDNLGGGDNGNPYFWSGDLPQLGEWYLLIGIVHPYDHGSVDIGLSGVYDINGNKVIDGTEYKWGSGTTTSRFRSYLYYSTDVNVRQYFTQPMLEVVDGSEVPLSALFNNGQPSDLVFHVDYDEYGRMNREWLPYVPVMGASGNFRTGNIEMATKQYYSSVYQSDFPVMATNDVNAYFEKEFEPSPLNRVLKQAAPGEDWKMGSGHEIEFENKVNYSSTDAVRRFEVVFTGENPETPVLNELSGVYDTGELYKTVTKDENHDGTTSKLHTTESYTDKLGHVVLKRTYGEVGSPSAVEAHDTHYVYDDYGNLTYVLPPKVDTSNGVSATELNELCYQYKYDHRNRLVEKKIPGKGWEHIVYNKLDQPVMVQDAVQRTDNEWSYTKYDAFGRVAYTGIADLVATRSQAQANVDGAAAQFEERDGPVYTTNTYPSIYAVPNVLHTMNYYDAYDFDLQGYTIPTTVLGQTVSQNVRGLPTGGGVLVLDGNGDKWVSWARAYDEKGRVITEGTLNDYLQTFTQVETKLDFVGRPEQVVTTHSKGANPPIVTTDDYAYDHMGRLTQQTRTIGAHTETIVENTYGELGQLVGKKVGGNLQTVDYEYNVRGWLKRINDHTSMGNDLFAFDINYNTADHGGTPLYNGNISETEWKTANVDNGLKWYRYGYDALNRLGHAVSNNGRYDVGSPTEPIAYDKNGNITFLKRKGHVVENPDNAITGDFGSMDRMYYYYPAQSNKVRKVSDFANDDQGFREIPGSTGDDFSYDLNGNMTSDANKGITSITYNHLNLPVQVNFGSNNIQYVYAANGIKLKKTVNDGGSSISTEYNGNFIYKTVGGNNELQFIGHSEGYITPNGGNGWQYVYNYKDHLGNVRLSYADADGNGSIDPANEVIEESNYYPFGLEHKGYNNVINGTENNYMTYVGKEKNESLGLNLLEMDWRQYDPSIGRFIGIDAMAESFESFTPYHYANNSPIMYNDPTGLFTNVVNEDDPSQTFFIDDGFDFEFFVTADEFATITEAGAIPKELRSKFFKAFLAEVGKEMKVQREDNIVSDLLHFFFYDDIGDGIVNSAEGKYGAAAISIFLGKLKKGKKGYNLVKKLMKKRKRLPTPDLDPGEFKKKGDKWIHKDTGAIFSKSKTSHGNPGNTGDQWKAWPKGTTDFGNTSKKAGTRVTIDGDGNVIGN